MRKAFIEEAVPAARKTGNPMLLSVAMMSLGSAAIEQGDTATLDACLAECAPLAARLGQPLLRWITQFILAGRALIAGDLERAEELAGQALEIGVASGQPDAYAFYAAQMFFLRWRQGRALEVVDELARMQADLPEFSVYRYGLASAYAQLERTDDARALIAPELATGFGAVVLTQEWALNRYCLGECVIALDDPHASRQIYDIVEPYADIYAGDALLGYDMFHLLLARLATTFGDFDRADAHFADTHVAHERMGAAFSLAKTQAAWADMLVRRGTDDDIVRARELATARARGRRARRVRLGRADATAVLARSTEVAPEAHSAIEVGAR